MDDVMGTVQEETSRVMPTGELLRGDETKTP
jgi:hypothetical protein